MRNTMHPAKYHTALTNDGRVLVTFEGVWSRADAPLDFDEALDLINTPKAHSLYLEATAVDTWDSSLIIALTTIISAGNARNLSIDQEAIPEGAQRLTKLALTVPPNKEASRKAEAPSIIQHIGEQTLAIPEILAEILQFIGAMALSLSRFIRGKSSCRWRDVLLQIQECGIEALPIVSLISLLVGAILAFVGIMQLQMFGATIYVASLVTISMTRIMGAIMTGIIMAGRTGAAFAATLGTMQANEEIDALNTLGITPYDFLLLPRVIALTLMTPLLVLYSDFMGMLGGGLVSITMLGLDPLEYYTYTKEGFSFTNVWVGLAHAFAFGIIISMTGCYQGLKCGRNAAAVGASTTAAVVYAIVGLVIATAILTCFFSILNI